MKVIIKGLSAISGLGNNLQEHVEQIDAGANALQPLSGLLGDESSYADLQGSWIKDRDLLLSRKWAPGSTLSVLAARQAIEDSGMSAESLSEAAIVVGSSRGNLAGSIAPWPNRRPFKLMAASNSMHGELASAISIELGIHGPWQTIASACSASLDALGMAWMMLKQGVAKHAVVVGVELPLIPELLDNYAKTGVLAQSGVLDPYSPSADGFFPGEAGSAILLEAVEDEEEVKVEHGRAIELSGFWCNSDAASPVGMPKNGEGLRKCLSKALTDLEGSAPITAVCPHASGTYLHGVAEQAALQESFRSDVRISLHPLKPFTGHTIGSSGVLETAIFADYMRRGSLPNNLSSLTPPADPFHLDASEKCEHALKIAVGMGGHNSVVSLQELKSTQTHQI